MDMIFFDKKRIQSKTPTTEGFYFGTSESEGETSYRESDNTFFDDYLDILPRIGEGRFIITGRKGCGKSAIAKYIKDNASLENSMFCEIVKSDAIKLEKQIQKSTTNPDEKLVSFFQWLILVKLVKLILESKDGNYTPELKAINNFVKNNRGVVDIDKFAISEVSTLNKQELNLGALSKLSSFKIIIERILGKRMEKAPYYKLLPALKEIVYKVLGFPVFQGYQFVVIFDDLDIGFKSDNYQDKQSLMELLRAAKEFNNDLKDAKNTKIIILLRDDVKNVLDGFAADGSKIFSSYEIPLKWYDDKNESNTLLRKFVNRRIGYNFKQNNIKYQAADSWISLIKDNEGCYGIDHNGYKRSAFKYILDFTFYRPRDLILFLKNAGAGKYYYPINCQNIITLLQQYVHENVLELKAELAIHYSQEQIREIFNVLRALSFVQREGFDKSSIITKLEEKELDIDIFYKLIDYSILLPFDPTTGKYYINYRKADPSDYDIDKDSMKYRLHKCVYAHFVPKSAMPSDV